jgi:tetratricopeptide (TPR) repeat protein
LLIVVCLAYLPVLRAGFIWDDEHYVTGNSTLLSVSGLRRIWCEPGAVPQYYPLTFTSFWLERQVWQNEPLGYHAVNVALHALSSLLLWQVLRQLNIPGAWLAAACFALHPVQVESVAWVTERKNVLSGVFYWLSLLAWLQYRPLPERRMCTTASRWHWYAIALCCYMAALLSKTVTCSLPAVILLIAWWRQGSLTRRDWLEMAPFFLLGMVFSGVTVWMETEHVGARGPEWQFSPIDRILIAGRALVFYASTLVWPADLTFIYPRWKIDSSRFSQYLYPLGVFAVVLGLWCLKNRLGRGPLVAVLCFAGTLAPALGFFNVYPMRYSFVADHFQYLACAALFALVASVIPFGQPIASPIRTALASGLLLMLGTLTWWQAHVYRNVRTVWEDTLAKNPQCWMAHNNLGTLCMDERDWPAAARHYQRTIELKPNHLNARYNRGLVEAKQGFPERAIPYFESVLRIQPGHAEAQTDMGMALLDLGLLEEAREHLERAIQLAPKSWRAQYGLGQAMDRLGHAKQAAQHYSEAIALEPHCALAQQALRRLAQSVR